MALERKYVVFKAEEFDRVIQAYAAGKGELALLGEIEIRDAHVFRDRDQFTPTVLYAYASALRNAVEILSTMGGSMSIEAISRLQKNADDFMDAADKAEKATNRKIPD